MSLWNLFWTFATVWAAPLVALWLCVRAVISRDSRAWRLAAVLLAFIPMFLPLVANLWAKWSGAPGGLRGTIFLELYSIAPIVPAIYLLAWAFRTRDERWVRVLSAILGVIGLCFPLMSSWRYLV